MPQEQNKWLNKNDLKSLSTGSKYYTLAKVWCNYFSTPTDKCSRYQDLAVAIPTVYNILRHDCRAVSFNQIGYLATELLELGLIYSFNLSKAQSSAIIYSGLIISEVIELASKFMADAEDQLQQARRVARA